ncbi:MAG: 2-C-methyl-D-erythritol 2,4-cyclodiphosphate synthase [Desulfomonilia bacterium]|jgi:2-C-methyl-D-erythritol 2,4-cyclodiphosphate synthase
MPYRVGIGFDIHRLVEGRSLILGGVTIRHDKGLLGHSDGDVIIHSVCDAILGALAHTDIGELYPDSAKETEGMNSLNMLQAIIKTAASNYVLVNIDINCICERPRLAGYRSEMINTIAMAAGIDPSAVSVKFRTHEGLGDIGEGRAIAAQAVVLLEKK